MTDQDLRRATAGPGGDPLWQHTCGSVYAFPAQTLAPVDSTCTTCPPGSPYAWQPMFVPAPPQPAASQRLGANPQQPHTWPTLTQSLSVLAPPRGPWTDPPRQSPQEETHEVRPDDRY